MVGEEGSWSLEDYDPESLLLYLEGHGSRKQCCDVRSRAEEWPVKATVGLGHVAV